MRAASADAAPAMPFPFRTRTATRERGQIGCAGGAAGTATFGCVAGVVCVRGGCAARRAGARPDGRDARSACRRSARARSAPPRPARRRRSSRCATGRAGKGAARAPRPDSFRRSGAGSFYAVSEAQVAARPVGERPLRPPAELARRERDVEDAPLQLAEPRCRVLRVAVDAARRRGSRRRAPGRTSRLPVPTLKTPPSCASARAPPRRRRRRRRSRASAVRRRRSAAFLRRAAAP